MKRTPLKRTPMKRSTKPMKKIRSKPRPGRVKGADMEKLRREVFERDGYKCQQIIHRPIISQLGTETGETMTYTCSKPVTWEDGELAHRGARRRHGDSAENTFCSCKACHAKYHSYGPSGVKPVPSK